MNKRIIIWVAVLVVLVLVGAGAVFLTISRNAQSCNYGIYQQGKPEGSPTQVANSFMNAINAGRWDVVEDVLVSEDRSSYMERIREICWIETPVVATTNVARAGVYTAGNRFGMEAYVDSNVTMKGEQQDFPGKNQVIILARNSPAEPWLVVSFTPDN